MARIVVLGESKEFKKLFEKGLKSDGHRLICSSSIEETLGANPHVVVVVADPQAQKRLKAIRQANPELKTILWVPDWSQENPTSRGAADYLSGARTMGGMKGVVQGALIISGELSRWDPSVDAPAHNPAGFIPFGKTREADGDRDEHLLN